MDLAPSERNAVGIAAAITRRIGTGDLMPGDRLPTVRTVARELKVSAATVSQAWQALAATGAIVSRGRAGTFVADVPDERGSAPSARYWRLHSGDRGAFRVDLSRGTPDPELLPPVTPALARMSDTVLASDYLGEPTVAELEGLMRQSFPARFERMVVMDGAVDAVDRLMREWVRFGDRVLLEDPGFPPFIDLVSRLGAKAVGVGVDRFGAIPADVAAAVADSRPAMLVIQPRAHNPTGASMCAERVRALADVLVGSQVLLVEDDHAGPVSSSPDLTLATYLPDQVVHVRSYSKSHGADLRLSMVGGPERVLDPVVDRRMLGPGWTSRLLQRLLLVMLSDEGSLSAVEAARDTYRSRSARLIAALADRGVDLAPADGINLWLPVRDESAALVSLAAAGIKVAPGGPFRVDEPREDHVRVTFAALADEQSDWIADELAKASVADALYSRRR
ncbi:aminotransferase class I/II-fold pyridoxal phosphate-dependent enzyme [Gordonia jinhuaensis]|uniref:GntR family transcriptional regulator n=1 Tax=Gordonia jinhuaensis TaxID=1517702 RepID=A0A916T1Q5_9ACTN|nr:aminotransferase class I/II-fold pyridoxal phosphate-dependent enzyme [Gordonia jinhuaensis]GGB27921.1 GntR family transcriptional regulator [Gordonia jinhuaensis]